MKLMKYQKCTLFDCFDGWKCSGTESSSAQDALLPFIRRWKFNVIWAQRSVYLWSGGGRWWWEGVGDEEDGGGDSGGIATGTQKRGSKQGEALTSACFTLERERGTGRRGRKVERGGQVEKQDKRKKRDDQQEGRGGRRAQGTAMCKVPQQTGH